MKLSKNFTKTNKDAKDFVSKNATYLLKAGFIDQTMSGVYTFLPFGWRVLRKIEHIVREEMDKIGQEMFLPALAPKSIWEATGRLETIDVLMKTAPANDIARKKHDAEYILNCTHEDLITPIASRHNTSYKDFPVAVYQIQTKFRNEPRAKSGILRGREFRMKDLYSFHVSEDDLLDYYDKAKDVYLEVYDRIGLGDLTYVVRASGGDFTKEFSHEFQTRCENGEDIVFRAKNADVAYNQEIAPSLAPLIDDSDEEEKPREDVKGEGIIGVEELAEYLTIPVEKTTKTILFEGDDDRVIAAAVRGGYEINEEKLRKVAGTAILTLASKETVQRVTGAAVGYAGILDLPDEVEVYIDESMKGRKNFECGANKTDYHSININFGRDVPEPGEYVDIKVAKEGDRYPETEEEYEVFAASEVGNIFPLNTKFSDAIGYTYTDEHGQEHPVYMGSYGIGTSRLMGVLVEVFADEKGLLWPMAVAPYHAHLISLPGGEARAQEVYDCLTQSGIEVLWDDREESAGVKFADADLIGIPVRLVVSKKTGESVEVKMRTSDHPHLVTLEDVVTQVQHLL